MMRRVLTFLAAGALLLAGLTAAHADPVSLVLAGVNALFGTTLTASTALVAVGATTLLTVGQAVSAALAVGLTAAASALSPRARRIEPQSAKETFETGDGSEIMAIGRVRMGGLKVFGNTVGADRYRVIAHCRGQIDGIESIYLGGREVIVGPDGAVSSPPYTRVNGSYVYINTALGVVPAAAWGELAAAFPDYWSLNHRGDGVAQSLVKYISPGLTTKKFQSMYQSGVPNLELLLRVGKPYDPRTGLNAWTDNGVLCCLHIALLAPEIKLADFDMAFIAAEANRADALVATRNGTERRSRLSGVWASEQSRGDSLKDALDSAGCEVITLANNKIGIRLIDDVRAPELTLPLQHIKNLKLNSGPESVERPNICVVRYYAPERNYEMAEINLSQSPWARVQSEIDRVGPKQFTLELRMCPSASQAQRIARRMFAMARADGGVATLNFGGLAAWNCRTVTIETELGDIVAEIEAPHIQDTAGEVEVPFREQPVLDAWTPAVHESPAPEPLPEMQYVSSVATPPPPTEAAVVTYPDGTIHTRFAYADQGAALTVEASRRGYVGPNPQAPASLIEYRAPGGFSHAYHVGALAGTQEARVRAFNADEDGSEWSGWASFTPVAVTTLPPAPGVSVEVLTGAEGREARVTVTAPARINVSHVTLSRRVDLAAPTVETIAVMPGEVVVRTYDLPSPGAGDPPSVAFFAVAYTAGGSGPPSPTITV